MELRECCESVLGDSHRSICQAFGDPIAVRVDGKRLHLVNVRPRIGSAGVDLVCSTAAT